jgi:hypothetical protein
VTPRAHKSNAGGQPAAPSLRLDRERAVVDNIRELLRSIVRTSTGSPNRCVSAA